MSAREEAVSDYPPGVVESLATPEWMFESEETLAAHCEKWNIVAKWISIRWPCPGLVKPAVERVLAAGGIEVLGRLQTWDRRVVFDTDQPESERSVDAER